MLGYHYYLWRYGMFKTVIAKAGLKKEEFKTVDKQEFILKVNNALPWMDGWILTSALKS